MPIHFRSSWEALNKALFKEWWSHMIFLLVPLEQKKWKDLKEKMQGKRVKRKHLGKCKTNNRRKWKIAVCLFSKMLKILTGWMTVLMTKGLLTLIDLSKNWPKELNLKKAVFLKPQVTYRKRGMPIMLNSELSLKQIRLIAMSWKKLLCWLKSKDK